MRIRNSQNHPQRPLSPPPSPPPSNPSFNQPLPPQHVMKKDLLRIRISDLKAYFGLLKDGLASEVLLEALAFAEVNKTWKFWVCCRCSEKFVDSESHMQNVVQEYMGNLIPKMQSILPQSVDNEWIEMLLNCSWDPLDISAVVKMIGN
ncbi:hypothetical protein V6N13_074203 [Hibiscus sabdariffa]|uniref:DUF629 domain-containing protein n=1 Tax=Hibiscus sabdariffa TaxID=183260 RepID=A0ABR2U818_9ROSI